MTDIKWLFFDIGSTLVDESIAYRKRIERTIADTDISYDEFYRKMVGISKQKENAYNSAVAGYGLNRAAWNSDDEVVYPDAEECLKELSKRYKIGIIANQNPGSRERLEKMGLLEYIDLVIASAEEGVAKPDLRIFKAACFHPALSVVDEDSSRTVNSIPVFINIHVFRNQLIFSIRRSM